MIDKRPIIYVSDRQAKIDRIRAEAEKWPTYADGTPIPLANLQPEQKDALFGKNRVER